MRLDVVTTFSLRAQETNAEHHNGPAWTILWQSARDHQDPYHQRPEPRGYEAEAGQLGTIVPGLMNAAQGNL